MGWRDGKKPPPFPVGELTAGVRSTLRSYRHLFGLTTTEVGKLMVPQRSETSVSELENAKGNLLIVTAEQWATALGLRMQIGFVYLGEDEDEEPD
jgi:hypothetical protein